MGLLLGGLLLSKFYAPPLVLMALLLMLFLSRDESRLFHNPTQLEAGAGRFGVIAVLILWAG